MSQNEAELEQSDSDSIPAGLGLDNTAPAPPPPQSSRFMDAFGSIAPAPLPSPRIRQEADPTLPVRQIPDRFQEHWTRVSDTLKNIPLQMKGFQSSRLTPPPEYENKMYGYSMCFSLIPQSSLELLMSPCDGPTYCFIAPYTSGIPPHIRDCMFLFDAVSKKLNTQNRSPYVFPTTDIGLTVSYHATHTTQLTAARLTHMLWQICRSDKKTVTGLYAKGGSNTHDTAPHPLPLADASPLINLLRQREGEQTEDIRLPIPEIKTRLGVWGCQFSKENDEKEHEAFFVYMVTPAANFSMWPYILEGLKAPKTGCQQYAILMNRYTTMKQTLTRILNYEVVVNCGVNQEDFGSLEDYELNPTGALGVETILSPFTLPIKMTHSIHTRFPGANSIQIFNMPPMGGFSQETRNQNADDWYKATNDSINAKQRVGVKNDEALFRYNSLKDKASFQDMEQDAIGGWPITSDDGTVIEFRLPPCQMIMSFDSHDIPTDDQDIWISSIGGKDALPELVSAVLRAFKMSVNEEDVFPDITNYLTDDRRSNAVILFNKYRSSSSKVFESLMLSNSQQVCWEAFNKDMTEWAVKSTRVTERVEKLFKYVVSQIRHLEGMGAERLLMSDTIHQMHDFLQGIIKFDEVCVTDTHSISNMMKAESTKATLHRRHDSMYRAWNLLNVVFTQLNDYAGLNPANEMGLRQAFLSSILYKFGGRNKTWTYFFLATQIMGGLGHYQITTDAGILTDNRKPNGTGADNIQLVKAAVISTMYEKTGTPDNERLSISLAVSRYTPTSWEQACTASTSEGKLMSKPPASLTDRPMYATESRQDNYDPLIQYVIPRGPQPGDTKAFSTFDPEKTGLRKFLERQTVNTANLETFCTNVGNSSKAQDERTTSLMVVTDVCFPGSMEQSNKRARSQFQQVRQDGHAVRIRAFDEIMKKRLANLIAYSNMFTAFYAGLMDRLHGLPYEINQTVQASLEWVFFYAWEYMEGVMEPKLRENFSRMTDGYTTRALGWFAWLKTIEALSHPNDAKNKEETVQQIILDLHADALPIIAIPSVVVRLLTRTVHTGWLIMTMLTAKSLSAPVVSWEGLNRFFDDDEPPSEPGQLMDDYVLIREFISRCIQEHRLCPERDEESFDANHNVCEYLTGEGRENMGPANDSLGFMRLPCNPKDKSGDTSGIFTRMGARVRRDHGQDLFKDCHMGKEDSVYTNALKSMQGMMLDLRGMGSKNIFMSEKHFKKMGLYNYVPGVKNYDGIAPLPFSKQVIFRERDQIKSVGFGVNPWLLLSVLSLTQEIRIHPSISETLAIGVTTQILKHSPPGITPSGIAITMTAARIFVPQKGRPLQFPRPLSTSFVTTGNLQIAKAIGNLLPEDMLHCSQLQRMAETLQCRINQVPAIAVKSAYHVEQEIHYPFHVPQEDPNAQPVYGSIYVDPVSKSVIIEDVSNSTIHNESFFDWELYMKTKGYVMMPLIRRGGACVLVNIGTPDAPNEVLGCLISNPETNHLFDHATHSYNALVQADNISTRVTAFEALEAMVKIGTPLYLNAEVIPDADKDKQNRKGKFLKTRLNVPNLESIEGKLYVSAVYHKKRSAKQQETTYPVTFAVNPWDLMIEDKYDGPPENILDELD